MIEFDYIATTGIVFISLLMQPCYLFIGLKLHLFSSNGDVQQSPSVLFSKFSATFFLGGVFSFS